VIEVPDVSNFAFEHELECFGLYGVGGGYAFGKGHFKERPPDGDMYCFFCPLSAACWEINRQVSKAVFPLLSHMFKVFASYYPDKGDEELYSLWFDGMFVPAPPLLLMLKNFEMGIRVAKMGATEFLRRVKSATGFREGHSRAG